MRSRASPHRKRNRVICPHCSGAVVYYRLKTKTYLCRTCGRVFHKLQVAKHLGKKIKGGI